MLTRRLPKISEIDPKNLEGVRGSTEVFRVSEVFRVLIDDRDFVEYTINKNCTTLSTICN